MSDHEPKDVRHEVPKQRCIVGFNDQSAEEEFGEVRCSPWPVSKICFDCIITEMRSSYLTCRHIVVLTRGGGL